MVAVLATWPVVARGGADVEAIWSWQTAPGIEWAAWVETSPRRLMVATTDGRLHVLDARGDRVQAIGTHAALRGVRLGEPAVTAAERGLCVCFDRQVIYGFETWPGFSLRWRFGRSGPVDEALDSPEEVSGWRGVAVTPAGVVGVHQEGRLVLLGRADGQPVWKEDLGHEVDFPWLAVGDDEAAVIAARGGVTVATLVALGPGKTRPREVSLGPSRPVWAGHATPGLVVAWSDSWCLLGAGHPVWHKLATGAAGTGRVAVFEATESAALLIVPDVSQPVGYSLHTGQRVWPSEHRTCEERAVETLTVQERYVVTTWSHGTAVYDAREGRSLWSSSVLNRPILSADVYQDRLRTAFLIRDGERMGVHVICSPIPDPPEFRPTKSMDIPLVSPTSVKQVLWTPREVLLVSRDAIRAYRLPE